MILAPLKRLIARQAVDARPRDESPSGAEPAGASHLGNLFDRSARAARIGVWECALPSETLMWTDVVYELFELPAGSDLARQDILKLYSDESLRQLTKVRRQAIEERRGFSLDAEIVTAKGNRRWIRITASIDCDHDQPIRIFGMKQDITSEKLMIDQIRRAAEFDGLTGLPNRAQFEQRFEQACARAGTRDHTVLFLLDLDGFKRVNDIFGHQAGDECLREAARRLTATLGDADLIARIGGDEFAILSHCATPEEAEALGARIISGLTWDFTRDGRSVPVGTSVGAAFGTFGFEPKDVFAVADRALYGAKHQGGSRLQTIKMPTRDGARAA